MTRVLITGGHLGPALAVTEEIGDKAEIIFVGRKYAVDREKNLSLEFQEISKKNIRFYNLQTGRLTRLLNKKLLLNILKIPLGFFQSFTILLKEKPDLIISFGGYLAFPVCIAAFILGVPVFTHEQTAKPGLTNRLIGIFAKKIFVTFPETKNFFPKKKVIISGNPVRKTVLTVIRKPFLIPGNKPVIYFTGGSLGSHSINLLVEKILPTLLEKYVIIQQTGKTSEYNDFPRLLEQKNKLAEKLKTNYFLREYFYADEIGYIYANAVLVVGRSGANTVFELIAWNKPAIFIPLPWSANREQAKHAEIMRQAGTAEIFSQAQNPDELTDLIKKVITNIAYYQNNFKKVKLLYKANAAQNIVKTIFETHAA